MSESGDKEFPVDDFGYLVIRSNLLVSMNQLRIELYQIWGDNRKLTDKEFDTYFQSLAARKQELLDLAHGIMSPEDYEKYLDMVELTIPLVYKKFNFKKMKKIRKNFSPQKLT